MTGRQTMPPSAVPLNRDRLARGHLLGAPGQGASTLPPMLAGRDREGEGGKIGAPSPRAGVPPTNFSTDTLSQIATPNTLAPAIFSAPEP
jgi:hypothetical protein